MVVVNLKSFVYCYIFIVIIVIIRFADNCII